MQKLRSAVATAARTPQLSQASLLVRTTIMNCSSVEWKEKREELHECTLDNTCNVPFLTLFNYKIYKNELDAYTIDLFNMTTTF
jgi:hypothetical protein